MNRAISSTEHAVTVRLILWRFSIILQSFSHVNNENWVRLPGKRETNDSPAKIRPSGTKKRIKLSPQMLQYSRIFETMATPPSSQVTRRGPFKSNFKP